VCICACSECTSGWLSSYLAGGDELERPEGGLHVRDVGLELVERSRDAGLDLRGLGPRGAVGRDLVEGLLRHDGRLRYRYPGRRRTSRGLPATSTSNDISQSCLHSAVLSWRASCAA
jgi:hypothetical protein